MSKGTKRTLFAHVISMIGSWWGIISVTLLVYFISPIPKDKLLFFFVWIFIPTITSELIKFIFKRKRPVQRGEEVKVKAYGYSFPSSHTVAAFMIAAWIMLIPELRWWSYLFISWPFIMGWSRVWLRAHDVVDVAGGFVFGVLATIVIWLVY